MSIETYKVMVVSTAHLDATEAYAFENPGLNIIAHGKRTDWINKEIIRDITRYGFLVHLVDSSPWSTKVPKRLRDLRKLAQDNGCSAIQFDADGPVVNGIKTFRW